MSKEFFSNRIVSEDMEDIYSRKIPFQELQNKTILVTGATGMLASYLVFFLAYLREEKKISINIIALVRSKEKAQHCFGDLIKQSYFQISDYDITEKMSFEDPIDYIIHAASLASPKYYGTCPIEVAAPNAIGTYQLLNLAVEKQCKSFLYFSTGDIYGKVSDCRNITEDSIGSVNPLDTHSCYNESKRMGENWCANFYREKSVPVKIARIWHTYSPTMDYQNDPRVFASFVKCAVEQKDIVMLSDGSATRTFCYITDAIAAFLLILLSGESGEAYNICNTKECISVLELARTIAGLCKEDNIGVISKKRDCSDSYIENKTYTDIIPQNEKLLHLGWNCSVGIEEGFSRVLKKIQEDRRG